MGNGNAAPQSSYALQSLGQSAKGGGAPAPGGQQFAPQVMPGQMFGQMPPGQAPQPMMPEQQALMQAMADRQRAQMMPGQQLPQPVPFELQQPLQQAQMVPQQQQAQMIPGQRMGQAQMGQSMPRTIPPRYFSNRAAQNPVLRNGIGAFNYFR